MTLGAAFTLLCLLALAVYALWTLIRTDWFDVDIDPADPWPPRRAPADLQEIRDDAKACAAIDHCQGGAHANPHARHSPAFVQWAIAYTETRELLVDSHCPSIPTERTA